MSVSVERSCELQLSKIPAYHKKVAFIGSHESSLQIQLLLLHPDLYDPTGAKTFYLEKWDTSLRYEITCDSPLSHQELVEGAKHLTGWIQNKIRRSDRFRRRK
ncbi:hypothetical protein K4A83_00265 [Spirulina subsalsa FACHB-351]|uniref:Uncharacterized protein n=1 Tax=Spirulina subsalsa FACHB-351 TaxID=234711 RepID=A0ABT3KZN8_9CYAN|nr:hypothetical protein [Spirulina subsalsa]MCW6034712.1 hypothetical protein [Spirulina subsalsa FACHB-351]